MTEKQIAIDFGAPSTFGAHVFRVEIPSVRNESIAIIEHYGYSGNESGIPLEEERVILDRKVWTVISVTARHEFNTRLKAAKMLTGRWHLGTNLVDRLLGKELCVLAWAGETANEEQLPIICNRWAALRPEERWWLFSTTVAEYGLPDDTQRGWRKALFYAFSEGKAIATKKKRRRPVEQLCFQIPLFKDLL